MALCLSPYGNDLTVEFPWINSELEKIQMMLEQTVVENKESKNPEIVQVKESLNELIKFRKIIPTTSLNTIVKIDEKISLIRTQLTQLSSYDAQTYYDVYFLQLGVTQKDNESYSNLNIQNTKSVAFTNWFSHSKVVDSNDNPLIVYHGNPTMDFTKFKFDLYPGAYFAENKKYSEWFKNRQGANGVMFETYLRILNPLDLRIFKTKEVKYMDFVVYVQLKYGITLPENTMLKTMSERQNGLWAWSYLRFGVDWVKMIKSEGKFDGIAFYENNPQDLDEDGSDRVTPAWMVFNSNQIKSSNSNVLFSENSNDIRFKKGGKL